MGHLRLKANEGNYKEHDGWLKEQFINGINGEMMTTEIVRDNHNAKEQWHYKWTSAQLGKKKWSAESTEINANKDWGK